MLGMSSNRNASNDFWWQTLGAGSNAGVRVTHESAMQSAIVYSCVKIISGTLASLPMKTYRRLDGGNKEEIPEHPLYELLHDQANEEHTAQEFRETMTAHALLRGTGIAEILPGNRGAIDQLIPIHPDEIKPVKVTDVSGRRRVQWEVRKNGEPTRTLLRDELLILRALVLHPDGILGIDPITAEANAIGARVASQEYAARFFQNDAQAGLIVQHPSYFKKKEDRDRFIEGWQRMSTGANRHKTRVLEFGMEAKSLTMTNEQAQFLETQKYQDNDIARIFNIPLHKVAILERATYTNIEQQAIEWVQDTLMPWAVRWTQCVKRDLIRQRSIFSEHNFNSLLRGDTEQRFRAYAIGRNWGWLSANDVRKLENMNEIKGEGDIYLQPLNMVDPGAPPEPSGMNREPAPPGTSPQERGELTLTETGHGPTNGKAHDHQ